MATLCKVLEAIFMVPHFPRNLPQCAANPARHCDAGWVSVCVENWDGFWCRKSSNRCNSRELRLRFYDSSRKSIEIHGCFFVSNLSNPVNGVKNPNDIDSWFIFELKEITGGMKSDSEFFLTLKLGTDVSDMENPTLQPVGIQIGTSPNITTWTLRVNSSAMFRLARRIMQSVEVKIGSSRGSPNIVTRSLLQLQVKYFRFG